uniref:Uncharacterized protein n=1 Tax=Anguilla anguilla TaxID=7936 RepID=A0A0E9QZN4_ANGAN
MTATARGLNICKYLLFSCYVFASLDFTVNI